MSFVHLHTHSHYSLLDGMAKIDDLISKAKRLKMPALALTDHGNMYGAVEFYKKAKAAGIKPILGVEVYLAPNSLKDKNFGRDDKRHHLVLLAKNNEGYKNLLKLVSISHLEGFYYKPRIDKEILKKYAQGLFGLSACLSGEIPKALLTGNKNRAEELISEYKEIFGENNFFLEIEHHPNIPNHSRVQKELVELAGKTNTPLVAAQDVHYLNSEDAEAQDVLLAVQTNSKLDDEDRLTMKEDDFSMRSPELMKEFFKETPEAIDNTLKIAEMCDLKLDLGRWVFPKIQTREGISSEEELKRLVFERLEKFIAANLQEKEQARKRAYYELEIIIQKGFAPYFLIVADIINFARRREILTNTRGSVAGSLVSCLIGITTIDPIKYKLPFERFLNPDRPLPPDIDMDFADNRRDEIIEYTREKYGRDKVAQIGTFGTMMARASVRDVTRALGKPYSFGDRLANLIPFGSQGFPITIDNALKFVPELSGLYQNDPEVKKTLDLAKKIEGSARHISVHAAGLVISPTPLINFTPLQFEPKGEKIITQYDMYSIEETGLLKFDFLGIKNLAILGEAVDLVEKIHGQKINIENIPLDDEKTFKMLSKGETIGLFQLAGNGMTRWLKELKPTSIHDVNAMVALFRPGPMEVIPEYIRRKHNSSLIKYLDPRLKEILSESYGVIAYQDDVLLIAINLAGYSWAEADKLRKAMGKKIPAEMAAQKEKLIAGFIKNGLSQEKARELWRLIEPFAAYGFNKSHAASYGRVAFQTAYFKANYPIIYMTAVLTAEAGDIEKATEIINECKRMGILVLAPDINESENGFTVVGDKIRFGLSAIKHVGGNIVKELTAEREQNGPFKTLVNFLERIPSKDINKKSMEALIKAGAFDGLGERKQMLENLETILDYHKESRQRHSSNQSSLFSLLKDPSSLPSLKLKPGSPASSEEKLRWEKELLGLYISGHPLDKFSEEFKKHKMPISLIKTLGNNSPVLAIGLIEKTKKMFTKNGKPMMFLNLSDNQDSIEVVAFSETLESFGHLLQDDNSVKIKAKVSLRGSTPSLILNEVKLL